MGHAMKYYPALLDLQGKCCVVVGGGQVAERKVQGLRKAQARVTVIGLHLTRRLRRLQEEGKIGYRPHPFRAGDLKGAYLAIAATDDRKTNERIFREATKQRVLANVVDDPGHSDFIVPSLVQRGDLLLAISTSGKSPALAKALRQKLERELGGEYAFLLRLLGKVRKRILACGFSQRKNKIIFQRLVREDLATLIRRKDRRGLDARLKSILGPGFSLRELGLRL